MKLHELEEEYKTYKKSLQRPRVRSKESKEKDRIYALAKYYAEKKLQKCELCNKSVIYLERHYLSKKHLARVENPIEVIKECFKEVEKEDEENKKLIKSLSVEKSELEMELEDSKKKITAYEAKEVKPLQLSELRRRRF